MKDIKNIAKQLSRFNESELDELTSILLQNYDISATIYRFRPIVENTECDLMLLKAGDTKLMLVKTIKEIFGIGLKEAKGIVDNAPCYLKHNISINEAEEIQEKLEECGATLEIC